MINFVLVGSVIADILVLCVFIASISQGFRHGITTLMFNLVCLIITVIAVLALCKPVTSWIYDNTGVDEFFSKHIQNTIGDFLEKQIEENGHIDASKTNMSKTVVDKINGYIDEAENKSVENISEFVGNKLSYIVISAIVVIVLCVVVRIATIFLRAALSILTHLPIIHSIDKVGGIAYGLLRAYIIVYFFLAVLSLLSPILANTGIISSINHSRLCSRFYDNNILLNILIK